MITTKAYLIREITKLKKKKRNLKYELVTLGFSLPIKTMFKNANAILEKELIILDAQIESLLWVANTNQKTLPKLKSKKKKVKKESKNVTKGTS